MQHLCKEFMNNLIGKLASQTLIYGLPSVAGRFLNYLLVPLYTRILPAEEYGQVSNIFAYSAFCGVFFLFGMETAFFYFSKNHSQPKKVFSTATKSVLLIGILLVFVAYLFQIPIMQAAGYPKHPEYAWWFALILASDAMATMGFAWFRYQEKAKLYAIVKLVNIFLNIASNLFFLILCPVLIQKGYSGFQTLFNANQIISYIFISNLIASLAILPCFFGTFKQLKEKWDKRLWIEMLHYSWPMVVIGFAGMINEVIDRILLKQILPQNLGDRESGIYSAFYKLSLIISLFIQAFRMAVEPFFFRTSKESNAQHNYAEVMKYFVYFCGFIYVFTIAFSTPFAHLFIKNKDYFEDNRGFVIVPVLLLANVFLGIYYNLSIWYKLTKKVILGAIVSAVGAVVTILGNLLFITKYSFVASAYTTLVAYLTMAIISYLLGKKYYPVPYSLNKILFSIMSMTVLGFIAFYYQNINFIVPGICIISYLILLFLIEKNIGNKIILKKNEK